MPIRNSQKSRAELLAEVEELSRRLEENEQILEAIRSGAVDAVVVSGSEGEKIFTLEGAEHPYRILVETMNEGAVTLDSHGAILYCNRRLAGMLRLPQEKIIGSSLASYVAPADASVFSARLAKCWQQEEKQEISLVTSEGARLPVLISCSAGDAAGSQSLSIIITDISDRKQAEKTILRLNRLYAVLSATNHAIVHSRDPLSIFKEFCRVAVDSGGFRLAWVGLLDGKSGAVKVAAAHGETSYLQGDVLFASPDSEGMGPVAMAVREGEYYICNDFSKDELTRWWHKRANAHGLYASASIAIKQEQEVVGALTLYADEKGFFDFQQVELLQQMGLEVSFALDNLHQSSLRNEAEQALRDETTERLRTVEELRKNEQVMIHQSRQAALGEMIGNIAHQWRQPLNTLGLLIQETPLYYSLGEVNKEYLEKTASRSMELINHMSQTIDDFRNFFKPNKEKKVFRVKEEIVRTLSLIEGSLREQQIAIELKVKGDPEINGYPNEFSQVLLNILINARDALTERQIAEPKVVIAVGNEKKKAVVTIADNAGGIPADIMGKIFDPYFTTKGPQSGTGVGLFMSKTIIEKNMGGRLTVRNTEAGAEFRIAM